MSIIAARTRRISWGTVRRGIKDTIEAAASSDATVHSRWAMRYSIEDTVAMIQANDDSENIHSWMLSVLNPNPDVQKTGGGEFEYTLEIRVWGLLGYDYGDDTTNSQDTFEDEVDDVIATLKANAGANAFGISENDGRDAIKEIIIPSEFQMDVMGFGEGLDVHLAQGIIQVRIVR
jgi:hypothetical protein